MKKFVFLLMLLAVNASAQLPQSYFPNYNLAQPGPVIAGEHTCVIWTGSDTLAKGGAANPTRWMQIGYSPSGPASGNSLMQYFNPQKFRFVISTMTPYPTHADNDSVGIGRAMFETAYDTTADRIWNPDSSHYFIEDGGLNARADDWVGFPFKRVATDTTDYAYPMRVLIGGYIRIWLEGWSDGVNGSILDDSCIVNWKVVGEN